MAYRFLNRFTTKVSQLFFTRHGQSRQIRLGFGLLGAIVLVFSLVAGYWNTSALSSDSGALPQSDASSSLDLDYGNGNGISRSVPTSPEATAIATGGSSSTAPTLEASTSTPRAPSPTTQSSNTPGSALALTAPSTVQSQPGASPRSSSAPSGTADRIAQATTDLPDDPLPDADTVAVPNLELYPPDIQRLMTQGYITVGIPNFDTPPLYFEKDGTLQGADVDLARNLGAQLELEVKFDREATTLNELIDRAARNQVDIAIGKLSTTVPRLKKLHASPNYIRFKQALLIDRTKLLELGGKDAESIQSILKTRPVDIGVIGKSSYERFAKRNFPNANVIGFPSWSDATEALAQGEVFAIYRDENEIKKIIMSRPQLAIRLKSVLFNDLEDSKSVYVSLQNPQLAHVIDNIIDGDPSNVWTSDRLIDEFYDLYTNPNFASN